MTLALAHSHAVPAFNGLYYATIATVIPVLFLAIAIQGNLFRDLIEASARSAENSRARGRYPLGAVLLLSACCLIVVYGGAGEITAITALLRQHDGLAQQWIAQPAVLAQTVITAAGPARIFLQRAADIATRGGTVDWRGKPRAPQAAELGEAEQIAGPTVPDTASSNESPDPDDTG